MILDALCHLSTYFAVTSRKVDDVLALLQAIHHSDITSLMSTD